MIVLVPDLRLPSRTGTLLAGLLAQRPAYASFFASPLYIEAIWTNHHATF